MNKEKIIVLDFYNNTLDVYPITQEMINKSTNKILEELGFDFNNVQCHFVADDFIITIH